MEKNEAKNDRRRTPGRKRITPEEYQALVENLHSRNPSLAVAAALGWYLGLRVTEITRLEWNRLENLEGLVRRMTIPAEYSKNHRARTLPITEQLAKILLQHYARRPPPTTNILTTDKVITHKGSTLSVSPRAIQQAFAKASDELGFGRITPHTLRHAFATRMLQVASTRLVQLALGHKSITSTEIYTHPTVDDIEKALNAVEYTVDAQTTLRL